MIFNTLAYNPKSYEVNTKEYGLQAQSTNDNLAQVKNRYKKVFAKKSVKNIPFTKDGFFSIFLSLKGKIAVSVGESEYILQGAKKAKEYGVDISFIPLKKDGTLDISILDDSFDFVFVSSYIVDTYVKIELKDIKNKISGKLISNASVDMSKYSDIYLLDSYKLCGIGAMGVVVFDDIFEEDNISCIDLLALDLTLKAFTDKKVQKTQKDIFLEEFKNIFKDELYLFIDPKLSFDFTLHLGLKDIKMRDIIRTLAFEDIYITNGEGCSLGLSRPSRILQEMAYSEDEARWGLSLDFSEDLSVKEIKQIVEKIYKKYKQIKALG